MAKPVHSMIRVLDEKRSLDFYARAFGLEVADHLKFPDFALIYLRHPSSPFEVELDWPRSVNEVACSTYIDWMRSCWYISATEHPALSVPCGFTAGGLPIGLQIVGRHRAELSLLQFGHAFESATRYGLKQPVL